MKRASALMAMALMGILAIAIVGCSSGSGSGSGQAPQSSSQSSSAAPRQALDPSTIEPGMVWDNDADNGTSDIWYKDGNRSGEGFFITNANNDAGRSLTWVDAKGSQTDSAFYLEVSPDKHLVNQSGHNEPAVDLVFEDNMTAYDNASGTRYSRGDQKALESQINDTTWEYKDTTFTFNADGTYKQEQNGKERSGVWEVRSPTVLGIMASDRDKFDEFRMVSDGSAIKELYWDTDLKLEKK